MTPPGMMPALPCLLSSWGTRSRATSSPDRPSDTIGCSSVAPASRSSSRSRSGSREAMILMTSTPGRAGNVDMPVGTLGRDPDGLAGTHAHVALVEVGEDHRDAAARADVEDGDVGGFLRPHEHLEPLSDGVDAIGVVDPRIDRHASLLADAAELEEGPLRRTQVARQILGGLGARGLPPSASAATASAKDNLSNGDLDISLILPTGGGE